MRWNEKPELHVRLFIAAGFLGLGISSCGGQTSEKPSAVPTLITGREGMGIYTSKPSLPPSSTSTRTTTLFPTLTGTATSTGTATLYAGTLHGVYKSTDGGDEWKSINNGLTDINITRIYIDPLSPATLYAVRWENTYSIYKSTNGGESWRQIITHLPDQMEMVMAIDPMRSSTLYAGTWNYGIYRSTNGGWSWTPLNKGLKTLWIDFIKFDPMDPFIIYTGTSSGVYVMHLSG